MSLVPRRNHDSDDDSSDDDDQSYQFRRTVTMLYDPRMINQNRTAMAIGPSNQNGPYGTYRGFARGGRLIQTDKRYKLKPDGTPYLVWDRSIDPFAMSQSKTREDNELPLEPSIPVISLNNFTEGSHLIVNDISMDFEKKHTVIEEVSEFWACNEHPDLLVCIGNEEFPCHRLLLSVYTDIVQLAKESGKLELPADQVPAKGFQQAYKWMLDGRTDLEQSLLVEILAVAKFLNIDELVQLVWYWLDKPNLFYEDQAFLVAHKALLLGRLMDLDTLMMHRIKCFFLTFVASREFISLPLENVCALLKSDELAVNTEKEVYFSAIRWLTHDWPARKEYVTTVLKTLMSLN
ncbi:uncharacterized protein Dwil_GK26905 [Drosophila willistoni]|uniref:BTB domain-containing protein n=1 Tax=Drosophila willistoni TaxID=7260 RepID=A0A0Q9WPF6_DROWI|nr:uncharacterized protein Dwil_GK26905 [Drosophila willistoni]